MYNETFTSPEERIAAKLRTLYGMFGYMPYKMSKFEEYDLYARNKEFLISDSIITFTDTDGRLMALKPDVTLSIIKNADTAGGRTTTKLFYSENVYRVSRGGTFREIMQTGLECIGNVDNYCLAEVLLLAAKSLAAVRDEYVLDVCQLDLLFRAVDLVSRDGAVQSALLRCAEEKNVHGIKETAKNAGAPETAAETLISLVELYAKPDEALPVIAKAAGKLGMTDEFDEFKKVIKALEGTDVYDNIRIDFSIVSDRNYYNGIAFKGYVKGVPERVLSGGQYDRLVEKLSKKGGAIGFAVYTDTLERLDGNSYQDEAERIVYRQGDEPGAVLAKAAELAAKGIKVRAEAAENE
ncbi:MAG: ATP phosphoribosyltransferase regulatory subunit [Clostridia bacterium]|nr:ATP phosphoribosyltransferase regulatory subunit [Clostridia bacterium]